MEILLCSRVPFSIFTVTCFATNTVGQQNANRTGKFLFTGTLVERANGCRGNHTEQPCPENETSSAGSKSAHLSSGGNYGAWFSLTTRWLWKLFLNSKICSERSLSQRCQAASNFQVWLLREPVLIARISEDEDAVDFLIFRTCWTIVSRICCRQKESPFHHRSSLWKQKCWFFFLFCTCLPKRECYMVVRTRPIQLHPDWSNVHEQK